MYLSRQPLIGSEGRSCGLICVQTLQMCLNSPAYLNMKITEAGTGTETEYLKLIITVKVLYTSPHLDISDPIHSNLLYTHQNVEDNKRNDGKDNV